MALTLPALCRTGDAPSLELADTRPAALARQWLTLCQTPDLEQWRSWIVSNLSLDNEERASGFARAEFDFCKENGRLEAIQVTESSSHSLTLRAHAANSGIWYELFWVVDDAGKISDGGKFSVTPPENSLPRDLTDTGIARYVRDAVVKQSDARVFSGIVVVARGTHVIVSAGGGFANRDRKTPITARTQFTLGSMAKLFTAVAVGQLIDQKKIALTDTVGHFFPDYPNATVRDKVTVEMLLSHTVALG